MDRQTNYLNIYLLIWPLVPKWHKNLFFRKTKLKMIHMHVQKYYVGT